MNDDTAGEDREEGRIEAALFDDFGDPPEDAEAKPAPMFSRNRCGLAVSLLLHGLAIYSLFFAFQTVMPSVVLTVLPVELVMAEETTAPQQRQQAAAPQRVSAAPTPPAPRPAPPPTQQLASLPPPPTVAPVPLPPPPLPEPPRDALLDRLEALSRLRQPETGNANVNANSSGARNGPEAYSVRDYVRAQVERRWSPDIGRLRNRNITVAVHVVLEPDGSVLSAEIVDQARYRSDIAYYELALSARNAVLLSSPILLPAGSSDEDRDMVLYLNPANLLR